MQEKGNREIKIGAILGYFIVFFNIIAGFLYTPWMIEEIGQSDYGIYGLATSLIAMFAVDCGLGNATSRFLAKYKAENNEKKMEEFLGVSLKLYLILDIIIFLILLVCFFLLGNIYTGLEQNEIEKLRVVFLVVGSFTIFSFPFQPLNGIISSHEKFVFQKIIDFLNKALTIFLMVILLKIGYGLYALVLVNAFVGIVCIFIKLIYLKKRIPIKINFLYWDTNLLKEIFSFSVWATVITIGQNMVFNIMPTVLGITSNTVEISKFTAASTVEGYVYTLTSVISSMFIPQLARMTYSEKTDLRENGKSVSELMIKIGRIQLIIAGAIVSVFWPLGKAFVNLWLPDGFNDTYIITLLMILPTAIIATQGIAETYVSVTGKIVYNAIGTLITALCAVVFAFAFSISFGAIGAGVGVFLGNTVGRIFYMNIIYKKKFWLDIKGFISRCLFPFAVPMILTVGMGYLINYFVGIDSWVNFIIGAAVDGSVYCVAVWLLALNADEKILVSSTIKKITGRMRRK